MPLSLNPLLTSNHLGKSPSILIINTKVTLRNRTLLNAYLIYNIIITINNNNKKNTRGSFDKIKCSILIIYHI